MGDVCWAWAGLQSTPPSPASQLLPKGAPPTNTLKAPPPLILTGQEGTLGQGSWFHCTDAEAEAQKGNHLAQGHTACQWQS